MMDRCGASPGCGAGIPWRDRVSKSTHVYGLTETYGPAVICAWNALWDDPRQSAASGKEVTTGVWRYHALEGLDVMTPETMATCAKRWDRDG